MSRTNKFSMSRSFLAIVWLSAVLTFSGSRASAQLSGAEPAISLNGIWAFKTLATEAGIGASVHPDSSNTKDWGQLSVPGNWDATEAYSKFRGLGLYRREIFIPKELENRHLRICFEAVYEAAKVYINGNYVGQHRGGYTPFEFTIDDLLQYGKNNTIAVVADNSYSRGAWWAWGGISRGVSIRGSKALRIKELAITPTTDLQRKEGQVQLRYELQNNDGAAHTLRIRIAVRPLQSKERQSTDTLTAVIKVPADGRNYEGHLSLALADSIRLWHFDFPNLYHCEFSVYEGNELLSRKESRFGFRKIEVKGTQFFLNGEAVRLMGFNRVHDHHKYGNTEPFSLIKQDIDHMKSLGCNMARMMHAPLSPELLNYADSVGMLLIEEIPVWGREDPLAFEDSPVAKAWLREMVTRDYNHPSVIGWSVANELVLDIKDWRTMRMSKEHYRYITSMLRYVKEELDSTRLATYVSLSAFREGIRVDQEPAEYADIICFNNYGDFVKAASMIHQRWPDKAVLVTEFGKGQIGEGAESKLDDIVLKKLKELAGLKYVAGASLWAYNDYRSNYPGTPASGNRAWGVVDVWRKEKKAAQQIREAFAPVAGIKAIWNAGRKTMQVEIQPREAQDLPSFTLKAYSLRMQMLAKDEQVIGQVSVALPDIIPGQVALQQGIVYKKPTRQVHTVKIQLVTPTGYVVREHYMAFPK